LIAWVRPSELLVLAWVVALVVAAPRSRGAWGAAAVALVARALAYGPDVHLHAEKAYHLLDTPFRTTSADLRYGDGWPALMVLAGAVLRHPDTVHLVNVAASVLTVPFLVAAVARVADARTATAAGLLLAVLPLAVASAGHEHQLIVVGLAQAAAMAGLLALPEEDGRRADALAATSLGMLAHTRPMEVGEAWLGVAWLAVQRRWAAAGAAAALVLWRTVELALFVAGGGNASGAQLDTGWSADLLRHLVGPGGRLTVLDPTVTPLGVTALALAGAALAWRTPAARGIVALGALDLGLYVVQPLEPDRLRLQLPAQVWLAALAAVGGAALLARSRTAAVAVAVGVAASFVPAREPFEPPWAWQAEYRVVRRAIRDVPRGALVRVDHAGPLADWAMRRTGARWWPGEQPAAYRWVGLADDLGAAPAGWAPVVVEAVPAWTEGTGPQPGHEAVVVGLWRAE
jgi:hypothetical protein